MTKLLLFILIANISGYAFSSTLFEDDSILDIALSYDISKLQDEKESLREEGLAGSLTTLFDSKSFNVEVLSRGNGSFDCQQPQIKLKFNKKENKDTLFKDIKKIKLFTKGTCLENKQDDEQDRQIIANFLIYKLYEEFSNYSYKVRLLKINYTDTSKRITGYTQYGFLLEPSESFEKRLNLTYVDGAELLNLESKIPSLINSAILGKVNSFEFFIANYDYGVPGFYSHILNDSGKLEIYYGGKNSKIYKSATGELYPVIYDFDFSRFGYFGPMCMFGFKFFMNDGQDFNFECSVNAIAGNIKDDISKFSYVNDVKSNSKELVLAYNRWKVKHSKLISFLGGEYKKGMSYFIEAFQLTI